MKRILMTAPYIKQGGVSYFVETLLPYFGRNNVIVFKRGAIRVGESKVTSLIRSFILPLRYLCSIILYRPQQIIINTSLSKSSLIRDGLLTWISKLFGKKVLLNIHGFKEKDLGYKKLLKCGYFKSDAIFVLSLKFKELLQSAGYNKSIYVHKNPVSEDILNATRSEISASLSNILFLSRVEEYKGIFIALEAYRELKSDYPDLHFDILGSGSKLKQVELLVTEYGLKDVNLRGYKSGEEKLSVLLNSDILFLPSYNEGLPICVLEAMSAGLIVITRPVGGLIDLYHSCNFGALVESKEPQDFVSAYKQLRNSKHSAKIGRDNANYAKMNFSPSKIVDEMISVLESI